MKLHKTSTQSVFNNQDQSRSHNAKKVTHIKGRLLYQAIILFNFVPFHNANFYERNEFAPRGS